MKPDFGPWLFQWLGPSLSVPIDGPGTWPAERGREGGREGEGEGGIERDRQRQTETETETVSDRDRDRDCLRQRLSHILNNMI